MKKPSKFVQGNPEQEDRLLVKTPSSPSMLGRECLDDDLIVRFSMEWDGVGKDLLTAAEQQRVEKHKAKCQGCRKKIEDLIDVAAVWRGEEGERRLAVLRDRVLSELTRTEQPPTTPVPPTTNETAAIEASSLHVADSIMTHSRTQTDTAPSHRKGLSILAYLKNPSRVLVAALWDNGRPFLSGKAVADASDEPELEVYIEDQEPALKEPIIDYCNMNNEGVLRLGIRNLPDEYLWNRVLLIRRSARSSVEAFFNKMDDERSETFRLSHAEPTSDRIEDLDNIANHTVIIDPEAGINMVDNNRPTGTLMRTCGGTPPSNMIKDGILRIERKLEAKGKDFSDIALTNWVVIVELGNSSLNEEEVVPEWTQKGKGLRTYAGGLSCVRTLLRIWNLSNLPPEIIAEENKGHTLLELVEILEKVAEAELWYPERSPKTFETLKSRKLPVSTDEAWTLLDLSLPTRPIMVPLNTEWVVVLRASKGSKRIMICDSGRSVQELEVAEFRSAWNAAANIALQVTKLRREAVSTFAWTALVPQRQLRIPEHLKARIDALEEPPGLKDAIRRYSERDKQDCPIPVTEENLKLVGKMLWEFGRENEREKSYWNVIVEGGLAGYALYVHKLVRIGWCFEQVPPVDPYSREDSQKYYEIEHALSLIVEHKFLQSVVDKRLWQTTTEHEGTGFTLKELVLAGPASFFGRRLWLMATEREKHDEEDFTLKELVLGNNFLTAAPELDWEAIKVFDSELGRSFLREEDFIARPEKVAAAREWYRKKGFPKML